MLSVVAEYDQDGFHEWRLPEGVVIVGSEGTDDVMVYWKQASFPITKTVLRRAFKVFLYTPGTVLAEDSGAAKMLRKQPVDYFSDYPTYEDN